MIHCNKFTVLYTALSCMIILKQHVAIKISLYFFRGKLSYSYYSVPTTVLFHLYLPKYALFLFLKTKMKINSHISTFKCMHIHLTFIWALKAVESVIYIFFFSWKLDYYILWSVFFFSWIIPWNVVWNLLHYLEIDNFYNANFYI
jgi:hypothetical protein